MRITKRSNITAGLFSKKKSSSEKSAADKMKEYCDKANKLGDDLDALQQGALKKYGKQSVTSDSDDIELEDADQEFSSAETAINGKQGKLPAIFKLVKEWKPGGVNLDFGGGTEASAQIAQDYLDQFNVVEVLYDKYNQSREEQLAAISYISQAGGADTCTCSNVLNVIKEESARLAVLNNIKKLMKPTGVVYITVYENSSKKAPEPTQHGKSWQNYRATETYLDEIRQVFPDATRKGKLVTCTLAQPVESSSSISGVFNNYKIIENEGQSYSFNYVDVSGLDSLAAFYQFEGRVTSIAPYANNDHTYAEISNGTISYYKSGLIVDQSSYMPADDWDLTITEWMDTVAEEAAANLSEINIGTRKVPVNMSTDYDMADRLRDSWLVDNRPEPHYEPDYIDYCNVYVDTTITVDNEGGWSYATEDWADDLYVYYESDEVKELDHEDVVEDIDSIIEKYIPYNAGTYKVVADIDLAFEITDVSSEEWGPDEDGDWGYSNDYSYAEVSFLYKQCKVNSVSVDPTGI